MEHVNPSRSTAGEGPPPDREADDLLGLVEAAETLGLHYMTAYRYVRTGRLDAHQTGGRWQVRPAALQALLSARRLADAPPPGRRASRAETARRTAGRSASALADRLIAGDEAGSWRIADDAFTAGADLDEVYIDLLGASLREVGDRWEAGRATVAHEHRASVVAMRLVGRLGPRTARPGRPRGTVVLSAAPGDRHALPSAILADLLRSRGLRVVDLGADTPPEHVAAAAADADRLVAVGICATTPVERATAEGLREAVRLVHERTGAPVLLGGRAMAQADVVSGSGAEGSSHRAAEALAWFETLVSTPPVAGRSVS